MSPIFRKIIENIAKAVKKKHDCPGYVYLDRMYNYYKCSRCRLRVDITVDPPDIGKGEIVEYAHKRKN